MGTDVYPPRCERDDDRSWLFVQAQREWEFLTMLRDEGRRSAEELLTAHASNLGARSTLDIDALLDQV